MSKYRIYEDKNNNSILLHKRVDDYYIVLKFNQIKLRLDSKKLMEMKNEHLKFVREHVKLKDKMAQILNIENDPDFETIKETDYYKDHGEGEVDLTKEKFEIHIVNKNSECLKYYCNIQFNEISIIFIKFVKDYENDSGLFDRTEYQGADYDSLNPLLQKYFVEYLHSLEVYPEIAKFIIYLGLNKNKRNYIKFLNDIKNLLV